jgi:hypothetical protein
MASPPSREKRLSRWINNSAEHCETYFLPIAWTVVAQAKGHLPESVHVDLMTKVQTMLPESAQVVLFGDGEFDGVNLQAVISHWQWSYVCRTAKSTILYWEGGPFRFDDMIPHCERGR